MVLDIVLKEVCLLIMSVGFGIVLTVVSSITLSYDSLSAFCAEVTRLLRAQQAQPDTAQKADDRINELYARVLTATEALCESLPQLVLTIVAKFAYDWDSHSKYGFLLGISENTFLWVSVCISFVSILFALGMYWFHWNDIKQKVSPAPSLEKDLQKKRKQEYDAFKQRLAHEALPLEEHVQVDIEAGLNKFDRNLQVRRDLIPESSLIEEQQQIGNMRHSFGRLKTVQLKETIHVAQCTPEGELLDETKVSADNPTFMEFMRYVVVKQAAIRPEHTAAEYTELHNEHVPKQLFIWWVLRSARVLQSARALHDATYIATKDEDGKYWGAKVHIKFDNQGNLELCIYDNEQTDDDDNIVERTFVKITLEKQTAQL